MSSWSCPHEVDGICQKVRGAYCDPGMLGCVVQGKVERIGETGPRRPVRASTVDAQTDPNSHTRRC